MPVFSQKQVEDLCVTAGFSRADARIASAIAMAEAPADGRPGFCDADAVGDQELANNTWGPSYGLFQIRSLRSHTGTGQYRDANRLPDPAFNCQSALTIFRNAGGSSFSPWSAYTSGQYKAYLQDQFPPETGTHVVVSGDTLTGIGARLGVDWREIARLNNLHSPYLIHIGDVLKLPGDGCVDYTVVAGDTLWGIGQRFGVPWERIAVSSGITGPYTIHPGDVLRVCGGTGGGSVSAASIRAAAAGGTRISSGSYSHSSMAAPVGVFRKDGAVYWTAGMTIDCDGRPGSICNKTTDPYYQAQTAFRQSDGQYLDAAGLPFIVIPLASGTWDYRAAGISGGDLCVVAYRDRFVYAVVGDLGPAYRIGEASNAAARALGINGAPQLGGTGSGVTYAVFPGVKVRPIESKAEAARLGAQKVTAWLEG